MNGYMAARSGSALLDRSDRTRIVFSGAKAAESLNGLFTNDVSLLKPGSGHYAAALTNKGKVIADVRVFARDGSFVVDTPAQASAGFVAMIRKYVNPRLAAYRDISSETGTLGVFGPAASKVVVDATSLIATGFSAGDLDALEPFAHLQLGPGDGFIARVPDLGVPGFDLFVPRAQIADIVGRLRAAGSEPMDAADAEVLRVEAGRPLYGVDMDENVLAQEAALDRDDLSAISFNKGCYTGQETVARVHFRGHVNRTLRGLRLSASASPRTALHASDGTQVGELRSIVESPRLGWIALGYVRREIELGADLVARGAAGDVRATVTDLPFRE